MIGAIHMNALIENSTAKFPAVENSVLGPFRSISALSFLASSARYPISASRSIFPTNQNISLAQGCALCTPCVIRGFSSPWTS